MSSRLQQHYKEQVAPALKEKFGYSNIMQIPRIEKVVLNVGVSAKGDDNLDAIEENLKKITGQLPTKTFARKSISNFKLREGQQVGFKVTLRGKRMYEFIDRLVTLTLPRVHDFRGLSAKAFDRQGNYTVGFKDQLAFPEIKAESIEQLHGLEVVIQTSAGSVDEGYELLSLMGFPLQEKKGKKKK